MLSTNLMRTLLQALNRWQKQYQDPLNFLHATDFTSNKVELSGSAITDMVVGLCSSSESVILAAVHEVDTTELYLPDDVVTVLMEL